MKKQLLLLFIAFATSAMAQVTDRYPNIQSTLENSVIIAWRTATASNGSVQYGTSAGALTNTATETGNNQIHAITLTGLLPNTQYYYKVVSGSFTSSVEYFYTAKPESARRFDFLAYGDCGFNNSVQNTIGGFMTAQVVDMGLVAGDIDQNVGDDYDTRFFQRYKDMLKHTCIYTAIGNHDVITNNTNYTDAFHLLHNNPAGSEKYYSFTWGNAKFITIDGNGDYTQGTAQYTWLEQELKCNDRQWTFVFFHQPPWTNGWDISYNIPFTPFYHYQGNADMRTSIVPLFEKYHVDFVINGHTHNYERGIYNGVRYFITGGAGGATPDTHQSSNAPNIQLEMNINNYMKWSVNGDTVSYYTYNLSNQKVDSQKIIKTSVTYADQLSATPVLCYGAATGTATATVVGPHPPYSLLWSNGATTPTATGLAAGTYQLNITDTNGCVKQRSIAVSQSPELLIQSSVVQERCPNEHNGKVTLNLSGGTPPYQYAWAAGTNADSLTAGTYIATITDANNCTVTKTENIITRGGLKHPHVTAANHETIVCKNDSVLLSADAGFVSYSWNNAANTASQYAHQGGAYFLNATDTVGCVVASDTVLLQNDSIPHLTITGTVNQLNAQLQGSQSGLTTYLWDFGNGIHATTSTPGTIYSYPDTGTYEVKLITQHYCGEDTATFTVHATRLISGIAVLREGSFEVRLAPNPFSSSTAVRILSENSGSSSIRLYSLEGKMIRDYGTISGNTTTISREGLAAGEYILEVRQNQQQQRIALIVE
ncbi:MAG: metallophosphoesterase [Chitinophagales bacterium]